MDLQSLMKKSKNVVTLLVTVACCTVEYRPGPLSGKGTRDFGMQYNGRWENEKISGYFLVWGKRTSVGGSGTNDGAREGVRRCPAAQGFGRVRGSGSPHRQQHVFRTKLNGWPAQCMANRKG